MDTPESKSDLRPMRPGVREWHRRVDQEFDSIEALHAGQAEMIRLTGDDSVPKLLAQAEREGYGRSGLFTTKVVVDDIEVRLTVIHTLTIECFGGEAVGHKLPEGAVRVVFCPTCTTKHQADSLPGQCVEAAQRIYGGARGGGPEVTAPGEAAFLEHVSKRVKELSGEFANAPGAALVNAPWPKDYSTVKPQLPRLKASDLIKSGVLYVPERGEVPDPEKFGGELLVYGKAFFRDEPTETAAWHAAAFRHEQWQVDSSGEPVEDIECWMLPPDLKA